MKPKLVYIEHMGEWKVFHKLPKNYDNSIKKIDDSFRKKYGAYASKKGKKFYKNDYLSISWGTDMGHPGLLSIIHFNVYITRPYFNGEWNDFGLNNCGTKKEAKFMVDLVEDYLKMLKEYVKK